jgi:hypothetical protein
VACTSISLVREQSEAVGPTRALWVPFALGRPLGSAEDPWFQKNVMREAFGLLESAAEPTIADYEGPLPEEAGPGQWACPLNLGPVIDDTLTGRLLAEVGRLKTWSAQTRAARGRTLFGVSGAAPGQVDDVARALASIADAASITDPPPVPEAGDRHGTIEWAFDMPLLIRHLADDLRTFYHEAIAAQPTSPQGETEPGTGPGAAAPNHDALNDWIFGGTALGETLLAVADRLTQEDDPMANLVRGLLIPEGRYRGGSAFEA